MVQPCEQELDCRNSILQKGPVSGMCRHCRFAAAEGGSGSHYKPISSMVSKLHPTEREEQKQRALDRQAQKVTKRKTRCPIRKKVAIDAERAERGTERDIIHATVNSGRSHQDLDHISRNRILLDSKNQSQRIHPVVDLAELDKARRQAIAAGYPVGALVLVNQHGRRVVVFDVEDYAKVVR